MSISRFIQSILLMLAVVGIFAAMARNNYGFELVGWGCMGLALLYLVQLTWNIIANLGSLASKDLPNILEFLFLSLFTLLLGLRAFYIYFGLGDEVFGAVVFLQMILYAWLGYSYIKQISDQNIRMSRNLMYFHISLTLFFLATLLRSFDNLTMYIGGSAVLISLPVLISIIKQEKFDINEKKITFTQFLISRNKAGLMFLFFLTAGVFTILTYLKILPSVENVNQPKDYVELVNRAENGEEKPEDGKYEHQRYKEALDKFIDRHNLH